MSKEHLIDSNLIKASKWQSSFGDTTNSFLPGGDDTLFDYRLSHRLSRRQFLKLAGATGAVLALGIRPEQQEPNRDYFFQLDLPSGYGLVKVQKTDTLVQISTQALVSSEQIVRENGVGNKTIYEGEYLLIPEVTGASVQFVPVDDLSLHDQLITRVVRNPNLDLEDDYTNEELKTLNQLLRWGEAVKKQYIGKDKEIDTTRGFVRTMLASPDKLLDKPGIISGHVENKTISCIKGDSEKIDLAEIGCEENVRIVYYYPGVSSLQGYAYADKLKAGYGRELFLNFMANVSLNLRVHLALWGLNLGPLFDKDRLAMAIGSLADQYFPDTGYTIDGRRIRGGLTVYNFVEWYLIRQNKDFFRKLLPYYIDARSSGIKPSAMEIEEWIEKVCPTYFEWKKLYDQPITTQEIPVGGREFFWKGAPRPDLDDWVTWAVPVDAVRWPNPQMFEKEQQLLIDQDRQPTRKNGMLMYRSWKKIGISKWGELPKGLNTSSAVPFYSLDPLRFSTLVGGKREVDPTADGAFIVGYWK